MPLAAGAPEPSATDPRPSAVGVSPSVAPVSRREPRLSPPHEPFTLAREGETLSDVAARVYGSPEEAGTLWRLNRDLIAREDGVLSPGTLLRTP